MHQLYGLSECILFCGGLTFGIWHFLMTFELLWKFKHHQERQVESQWVWPDVSSGISVWTSALVAQHWHRCAQSGFSVQWGRGPQQPTPLLPVPNSRKIREWFAVTAGSFSVSFWTLFLIFTLFQNHGWPGWAYLHCRQARWCAERYRWRDPQEIRDEGLQTCGHEDASGVQTLKCGLCVSFCHILSLSSVHLWASGRS